jgi:hypothetical protein
MMKKEFIFVTMLLAALSAFSTDYYADASRPDDSGAGTSWATAKKTIQAAVNLTINGDMVFVTNGIYNRGSAVTPGASLPNRVVATNTIVIQSVNGPAATIIQGQGPIGIDAVRGVYLSGGAQLVGFTIENGTTRSTGNGELDVKGGAGYCNGSSLVSNCVVRNNSAWSEGGGFRIVKDGNVICNSVIESNQATWAGGGISLGDTATSVVRNCQIVKNQSDKGGGIFLVHSGVLQNCLIAYNEATTHSGGVYVDWGIGGPGGGGDAYIKNCTIAENEAPEFSGYGYVIAGARVQNSIIQGDWGRSPEYWAGAISFEYCVATPLPDGTGNLTTDPLFVDATNGDFRLMTNSPCVNAGYNTYATTDTDLASTPRIFDGTVDMGAYETNPNALTQGYYVFDVKIDARLLSSRGEKSVIDTDTIQGLLVYNGNTAEAQFFDLARNEIIVLDADFTYDPRPNHSVTKKGMLTIQGIACAHFHIDGFLDTVAMGHFQLAETRKGDLMTISLAGAGADAENDAYGSVLLRYNQTLSHKMNLAEDAEEALRAIILKRTGLDIRGDR